MIVKDLSNSFNPVPKNKRIVNKKLLKDKKKQCEICGKRGQTEKHHIKTKGSGGDDVESNLIEVCRICHRKIHDGKISKKQILEIIGGKKENERRNKKAKSNN